MTTRVCKKCFIEKDLSDFHNCKKGKFGKKSRCKKCSNEIVNKYNQKDKVKERIIDYLDRSE